MTFSIRPAAAADVGALSRLWYEVWVQSHRPLMPESFARFRTLESFRERLPKLLPGTAVAESSGRLLGFCTIRNDELYQLYIDRSAQGTGVAAGLLEEGEQRLAARGVSAAWLSCAIGNDRAIRFYEKHGWRQVGSMIYPADTPEGPVDIECWRFEKALRLTA